DATANVMEGYIIKDTRLNYFHRSSEHLPGGNGARNYGIKKAEGDYIIFFDSDDLMTKDHIQEKIDALLKNQCDYVISKTKFFDSLDPWAERMYNGIRKGLTAENFIMQQLSWLTPDCCIKRTLAASIQYNELIRSGQEF